MKVWIGTENGASEGIRNLIGLDSHLANLLGISAFCYFCLTAISHQGERKRIGIGSNCAKIRTCISIAEPSEARGVMWTSQLGGGRHDNAAGISDGFQPAGQVDRISPEIIGELLASDNARDDRAGTDADAQMDGNAVFVIETANLGLHIEGQFGDGRSEERRVGKECR